MVQTLFWAVRAEVLEKELEKVSQEMCVCVCECVSRK